MRLFSVLILCCFFGFAISGCAEMPHPQGKPLAEKTYLHLQPLVLDARFVDVVSIFDPAMVPVDVSGRFLKTPESMLLDYARARYAPGRKGTDIFRFVVENAAVTSRALQPDNVALRWTGMAVREEFTANIKIGLYRVLQGQYEGPGVTLNLKRSVIIPERVSIARRERLLQKFAEEIVRDMDGEIQHAVIEILKF